MFFSLTLNLRYTLATTTSWKLVAISLGDDDTVFNLMFNLIFFEHFDNISMLL